MNKFITVALLCAPFTLNAAYFEQENVSFDRDGKPLISAQLSLPPLAATAQETHHSSNESGAVHAKRAEPLVANDTDGEPPIYQHSHFIYADERYVDAINRWLKRDNITHLAWAIDDIASTALNSAPTGTLSFEGDTQEVVHQLSRQLGVPFYMALDNYHPRAAIHQWHNREVNIAMVGGVTLKDTVRQLTLDYGWQWIEGENNQSWLAANDYNVSITYPIVTPKGDLRRALQIVLEGYPVSARLLEGSNTLFIVDTQ